MKSITTQNETLEVARERNIADALAEDIGTGDWTAQLVPANKIAHAKLIVRQSAVLCGAAWFEGVIHALDPKAVITWQYAEGETMRADSAVCTIDADARALLSAERPAMNFLQTLSWTATSTRAHVDAMHIGAKSAGNGRETHPVRSQMWCARQDSNLWPPD